MPLNRMEKKPFECVVLNSRMAVIPQITTMRIVTMRFFSVIIVT